MPVAIYPFGQTFTFNDTGPESKQMFYQLVRSNSNRGTPEQVAQQFANNPFGVSYQELYGLAGGRSEDGGAYGGGGGGGGGYGSGSGYTQAEDISFLNDQEAQLRSLLGRTDTNLAQGLQKNEDEYAREYGSAQGEKERTYGKYQDQRVKTNQEKVGAYDTINKGASNAYRSLAQIIGRAAGRGSSAFRELLPDVVGKETSSKRREASDTYGRNLQDIDKAQGEYDISFAGVLEDLLRQKRENEERVRSAIESQRQDINAKLAANAGQRAQVAGGGYAAVKAAQAPFQAAIENSRNAVEGFFNSFRTPYTPKQAVAVTPELAKYATDRSVVNAGQQGLPDPNNPYTSLLRKRLQEQAPVL